MIELTTGIALLMSSLYGAGHANAESYVIPADLEGVGETAEAILENTRSFTDPKEVEAYIRANTGDAPILVDIARCESVFTHFRKNGTVVRGRIDRNDVGVMQINERYHANKAIELGHNIYTVEGNLDYAKYLYGKYGSKPWAASQKCWSRSAKELAKN